MDAPEIISEFYKKNAGNLGFACSKTPGIGHFNVFTREHCSQITPYTRRDYYKISLMIGKGKLHYADKWMYLDRPALLFSNPAVPYSWEAEDEKQTGWFCLFSDQFLQNGNRLGNIQDSQLFKVGEVQFSF